MAKCSRILGERVKGIIYRSREAVAVKDGRQADASQSKSLELRSNVR